MKLSIITVSHNSFKSVKNYVNSFLETNQNTQSWVDFIIVENSGDDSIEEVFAPLINSGFLVRFVYTQNNGFGAGCNSGALVATGNMLAFVNPDVSFLTPLNPVRDLSFCWGTVHQKTKFGRSHSVDRFPELRSFLYELSNGYRREQKINNPKKLFAIGSFLLVDKLIFQQVGGFNERFFLYYEEAELGRRLLEKCGPLVFLPSIEIIHYTFGSYSQIESAFPHEARGLLTYAEIVGCREIVIRRKILLFVLSLFSKVARRRSKILKDEIKRYTRLG
jgi:GT2 family glycosyltransferase